MASPATLLRTRIKDLFETEFAAEGWTVEDTKLLRAVGEEQTRAACYPEDIVPDAARYNVLRVRVVLQLYLQYEAGPDPEIEADPTVIEEYADRFYRLFEDTNSVGLVPDFWFLKVLGVEFPDDPAGKRTRFEATIEGRCENPSAV